jgi:hypothetical protein
MSYFIHPIFLIYYAEQDSLIKPRKTSFGSARVKVGQSCI